MTTHNANNERTKRRYFAYLKEAKRHSEPTVDAVAKALARFESDTKHRDFKSFHFEQAIAFKRRLAEQKSQQTGEKLSKATMVAFAKPDVREGLAKQGFAPQTGTPAELGAFLKHQVQDWGKSLQEAGLEPQ